MLQKITAVVRECGAIVKSDNFEDIDDYFQIRQIFVMANNEILREVPRL